MKPFDLELAKQGKPVCTRDGRPVRILCFDRKSVDGYSILALVDEGDHEGFIVCTSRGKFYKYGKDDPYDLFMAPVKKEGWVNLYKRDGVTRAGGVNIYQSMEEAMIMHAPNNYIATVKIEWEE